MAAATASARAARPRHAPTTATATEGSVSRIFAGIGSADFNSRAGSSTVRTTEAKCSRFGPGLVCFVSVTVAPGARAADAAPHRARRQDRPDPHAVAFGRMGMLDG